MPPPSFTTSAVTKPNEWKTKSRSLSDYMDFQGITNSTKSGESRPPSKTSKFTFQKGSNGEKRAKTGTTTLIGSNDDSLTQDPEKTSTFGFQTASNIMERKTTGGSGFITPATEFIQSLTTSATTANEPKSAQRTEPPRNSFNSNDSPEGRRRSFEYKSIE